MKKKILWCGLSFLLVAALVLASCAKEVPGEQEEEEEEEEPDLYEEYMASLSEGEYPVPRDCFEQAIEEGQLNIYDWADWWPEELFSNFSEEFGIKIIRDHFGSASEMITKIKLYPEAEYDLLIQGGTGFAALYYLDLLKELNWDWMPNQENYMLEPLMQQWSELGYKKYGVPWEMSIDSYCYNTKHVDDPRIPSWSVVFEPDEKYRGRITMVDDMNTVIGQALLYLGYHFNSDNEQELMEARDLLLKQKPYLYGYDSYPKRLAMQEEIWIWVAWNASGYPPYLEGCPLVNAWPTEGATVALDPFCMPIGATHPAAAHLFANYLARPQVNTTLINGIAYSPTSSAVKFEDLSEELRNWSGFTPPEGYLEKCEPWPYEPYSGKALELRIAIWEDLKT
ncbi:hypothetical protein ES707_15361 [subsurface metagenome]